MTTSTPMWVEVLVAVLLLASGVLSLLGGVGLLRFRNFFQRMHPTALGNTLATWCVALATVVYFSAQRSELALYPWVIVILVAMTAPVTTVLLARAALFRKRQIGAEAPPPLDSGR